MSKTPAALLGSSRTRAPLDRDILEASQLRGFFLRCWQALLSLARDGFCINALCAITLRRYRELASHLTADDKTVGLQASGGFDAATSVLTSQRVLVEFKSTN